MCLQTMEASHLCPTQHHNVPNPPCQPTGHDPAPPSCYAPVTLPLLCAGHSVDPGEQLPATVSEHAPRYKHGAGCWQTHDCWPTTVNSSRDVSTKSHHTATHACTSSSYPLLVRWWHTTATERPTPSMLADRGGLSWPQIYGYLAFYCCTRIAHVMSKGQAERNSASATGSARATEER